MFSRGECGLLDMLILLLSRRKRQLVLIAYREYVPADAVFSAMEEAQKHCAQASEYSGLQSIHADPRIRSEAAGLGYPDG